VQNDRNTNNNCDRYRPDKEYTRVEVLLDNLPYGIMAVIGSGINLYLFGFSLLGIGLSLIYLAYCMIGALWIIIFVCPYCHYFDTRLCPCGYGKIAARFREKSTVNQFPSKFKKHIPVIVPLWIIPLIEGIVFLIRDYSFSLLLLILLFFINSFIVLPLLARLYGCGHCPQKNDCPWMLQI
jgi:hypothetical protein